MLPMLRSVLGNLLRKPATIPYPAGPKTERPRARGHIVNHVGQCIFCGMCMRKCPTRAITVLRPEREWTIRRFECVICGCCVEVCPKKCLEMSNKALRVAGEKLAQTAKGKPLPEKAAPDEAKPVSGASAGEAGPPAAPPAQAGATDA